MRPQQKCFTSLGKLLHDARTVIVTISVGGVGGGGVGRDGGLIPCFVVSKTQLWSGRLCLFAAGLEG